MIKKNLNMGIKKRSLFVTPLGVLIAFVSVYTIAPILSQLVSDYLSTYIYMALLLVLIVGLALSEAFHTLIRYAVLLLPLLLFYFLNYINNRSIDLVMWGYQTMVACLPLLLGFYLCHVKKKLLPLESGVLVFSILATMVTTVVGLIRYPTSARMLATEALGTSPMLRVFNMNNIGGYDFIYLLVLCYPLLIYAYKRKKIKLIPTLIISLAIFFCLLQSEYTLAILFFSVSTVLFFVKRNFSQKKLWILILVSTLLVLIFRTQVSRFLTWVAQYIESTDVRERILAMAGGRQGMDALDDKRIELYLRSINAFRASPILGRLNPSASSLESGAHSFIMDALAELGLLGGALLFFVYRHVYKLFFKPFRKDEDYGFILWCFLQPLLLSLLNPGMWEFFLMFAAPVLIRAIRGEDAAPAPAEAAAETAEVPSETSSEAPVETPNAEPAPGTPQTASPS